MAETIRSGRCLCGDVTFSARGEPEVVAHCHCRDCQRLSGTGHSVGAMYAVDCVTIRGTLKRHENPADSSSVVSRAFCPSCGSPVHGSNSDMPGYLTLGLGLFDNPGTFVPQVAIFARHRHAWDLMDDGLATFDTQPNWTPAKGIG